MKVQLSHAFGGNLLSLALILGVISIYLQAQERQSKPIDLDKELQENEPPDRAKSYYHYSLARWYESDNEVFRALSEMRAAIKYNDESATLRVELAGLLERAGNLREAMEEAKEAARLDPKDPEPHWVLANLYFRSQPKDKVAVKDSLRKAVKELETMRDLAPQDGRPHFALGGAYFELGETERAIKSYETFQTLAPSADAGYVAIADYYQRSGNREQAIEYLKKALESQPESPKTMMMLASLLAKLNKDQEAIPLYRKILQVTGDDAAVKRELAASLLDIGELDEAKKTLEELTNTYPTDLESRVLLGRAQLAAHDAAKAEETFKAILETVPDHLEAQFYLANTYEQTTRFEEAAKLYAELLEKSRGDSEDQKANRPVFQQHLAGTYQDMGENAKAIAIYEDILKNQPQPNPRIVFFLVNAYRINRQFDKALSFGKQEFEKNPKDTNLALVYARSLADTGKTKEGAELLNKMLQLDPSNVDIYVNLSQIYLQGKRYGEAEKAIRRAEDKKLDNERLKFQLGTVYERQKDFERAESVFREILKANPKNANALNYIGYMLADRGVRLQEAVQYVQEALTIEPNNGAYLDSLGWAFYKLDDIEKAEKYLLKAVELVKNDPTIHDHLGDLYFRAGDLKKAQEFWTKSLSTGTEPEEIQKVREKLEKLQEMLRKRKRS